jgi:hypothetical protein
MAGAFAARRQCSPDKAMWGVGRPAAPPEPASDPKAPIGAAQGAAGCGRLCWGLLPPFLAACCVVGCAASIALLVQYLRSG